MSVVFVSHASGDRQLIETLLLPILREERVTPWYSTDDIQEGEDWVDKIVRTLDQCSALIVAMTPNAESRKWIKFEANWALSNREGRVLPVLLAPCNVERIHPLLTGLQRVDLTKRDEYSVDRLRRAVRRIVVPGASADQTPGSATVIVAAAPGLHGAGVPPITSHVGVAQALLELGRGESGAAEAASRDLERCQFHAVRTAVLEIVERDDRAELDLLAAAVTRLPPSQDLVLLLGEVADRVRGPVRQRVESALDRKRARVAEERLGVVLGRVDRRYRIDRALGQGLQTTSFVVNEVDTGKTRVLRVLRDEWAQRPMFRDRFIDAAERSREIHHAKIVATQAVGRSAAEQFYYVIRDHVDGPTLRELFEQQRRPGLATAIQIIRQLARTMSESELHERVPMHGALRPSNLHLRAGDRLVVGDFAGVLPAETKEFVLRAHDARYAAPESFGRRWSVPSDAGSAAGIAYDIYSFGAVAHELVYGQPHNDGIDLVETLQRMGRPWAAPDHSEPESCIRELHELLARTLAPAPGGRPRDWTEVLRLVDVATVAFHAAAQDSERPDSATFLNSVIIGDVQRDNATMVARFSPVPSAPPAPPAPAQGRTAIVPSETPTHPLGHSPIPAPVPPPLPPSPPARRIMSCHMCRARFDATRYEPGQRVRCGRCQVVLIVPAAESDQSQPADDRSPPRPASGAPARVPHVTPPQGLAQPPLPSSAGGVIRANAPRDDPRDSRDDLWTDAALQDCGRLAYRGVTRPRIGGVVLLKRLGQGGMGSVYLAANPRLENLVAVKVLAPAMNRDLDLSERFRREARLAASVDSPHLVRVLDVDFDRDAGLNFIVMEYVAGVSAEQWRRDSFRGAGEQPPPSIVVDIVMAASLGLAAAHARGIVHRDFKPGNILIPGEGDVPVYRSSKLADLGLARNGDDLEADVTHVGTIMGTPGYMAPEQISDSRGAGARADVFGAGATIYALLAGATPFKGETPMQTIMNTLSGKAPPLRTVRPDVRTDLADVVGRCLRADPAARFPDGAALHRALDACRGGA